MYLLMEEAVLLYFYIYTVKEKNHNAKQTRFRFSVSLWEQKCEKH